ncbi:GNAT family N-acetyltransferase [Candidatus Bipolaricaulota bacterium]|nr:GNAT family N-acetyltransferase [Candidatus Bipolaricaulota bacterium]
MNITETVDRKDIEKVEKIEKEYYGEQALPVDILIPTANFLGYLFVAKIKKIVGYTAFLSTKEKGQMYCAAITVLPEFRRRGIATELLERAEEKCRQGGTTNLVATVGPTNIASLKTFVNNRDWLLSKLLKGFYKENQSSLILRKVLSRSPSFTNKIRISTDNIDKLQSNFSKGYYGFKISNSEILMGKYSEGDLFE